MVNWFKKNSQKLAVLVIVISLCVGAVGLLLTQKRLADTQEQLLNIADEQQQAAKSRDRAVEDINKETRRIGVVLCAIIRQQDPDLTEEERREIKELCEMEFQRNESVFTPGIREVPSNGTNQTNRPSNSNGNDTNGGNSDNGSTGNNGNNGLNGILQPIRDLLNL